MRIGLINQLHGRPGGDTRTGAQINVPDGIRIDDALARTTHLAVGAHQDDIPIMAYHGILECLRRNDPGLDPGTYVSGHIER